MFDTYVLDTAIAEQRDRNEKERQKKLSAILNLLDEIGAVFGLETAYIFGSVTMPGRFRAHSDIDIAVSEIEPTDYFDLMTALSTTLGCDVDLVQLEHCHFADRILQTGIKWMKKR